MDLALLELEYAKSLGTEPVERHAILDTEPPNPDALVSVWRSTTHSSSVAHGSHRGLVSSPLLRTTEGPVLVSGPKIGLSIMDASEEDEVVGTVVSSPVLESKMHSPTRGNFMQWQPGAM